ncbi:acyl-CoA dehydrogenase [Gordonia alkaliphila]|uniref:Acyl-CoA dehydrogenase n=2 Tax=Gordonia alkaliphila TaxID=1053547 RepID=A0ABP8YS01_9ACTN
MHTDLASTVEAVTARAGGIAVARAWSEGDREPGLTVYRQLAESGITGLLVDDALGGSGAGAVEMVVALEQLGRVALPGPVAETLAVAPALLGGAAANDDLAPLLAGDALASVACAPVTPRAADAEGAAVYLVTDDGLFRGVADGAQATVDPARTVSAVSAGDRLAGLDATAAVDLGALATSALSLGLAAAMLELAADYAKSRNQFGRAIGSFQAVKHHLADVAIAVEMARPLVWGAAVGLDGFGQDTADVSRDVSAAKVATAEAADVAARRALQVLGAIGYTAEHDFSLYLTKARALRSAWGTPAWHRQRVLDSLRTEQAR